jgi:hypothetical protein
MSLLWVALLICLICLFLGRPAYQFFKGLRQGWQEADREAEVARIVGECRQDCTRAVIKHLMEALKRTLDEARR